VPLVAKVNKRVRVSMSAIAVTIALLFFPACLGLLGQVLGDAAFSEKLLALGILLLCVDQARMAVVDLEQVTAVKRQVADPRLQRFYQVTLITIVIELCGFYGASISLGWGAITILLSQVWFNLCAGIQLDPTSTMPIRAWGVRDRLPVLIANGIGLFLVSLWMLAIAPLWISSGLLGLLILYGCGKYVWVTQ
jgi:hypothetical protein